LGILRRRRRDPASSEISPALALTGQCDFHGLLLEGVDIRVAIKPATPRRFPIVNPYSFT